ncbi:MAG: nucleotidyltransferase domain-containing protein [bacterium]
MTTVEQNTFGISNALIQQVTERIVRECHPHKIILFGSLAWGKPKRDSDLDLLISMDSDVARPDIRALQIHRSLQDLRCPMDLLVYTPEEVANCLKRGNLFIRDILEEGRLLYARQHVL